MRRRAASSTRDAEGNMKETSPLIHDISSEHFRVVRYKPATLSWRDTVFDENLEVLSQTQDLISDVTSLWSLAAIHVATSQHTIYL